FLDDAGDDLRGDWLDVGTVGHLGVGHDGGRVRVDEDDRVAFLAQGLAGLRTGVVELTRLTDDDWSGADEQDLAQVGSLWHCWGSQESGIGGLVPLPDMVRNTERGANRKVGDRRLSTRLVRPCPQLRDVVKRRAAKQR